MTLYFFGIKRFIIIYYDLCYIDSCSRYEVFEKILTR